MKNDAEIEADVQAIINNKWPPALREKAIRLGGTELLALNDFFVLMSALKAAMITERDAAVAAEVERAIALAEVIAADGGFV